MDATIIEADKQQAHWTYKKTRGYQPMMAYVSQVCIHHEFRDGNESPGSKAIEFLEGCEQKLPKDVSIYLRSDSAYYQGEVIGRYSKPGRSFSITADSDCAVRQAIDLAFERHPEAARFTSQGLTLTPEKIDLEVRICGSRPEGNTDSSLLACSTLGGCARLARILYDFYMQSGYKEFFDAAAAVYNYVGSALPNEAAAFTLVLRSELRLSGLPAN